MTVSFDDTKLWFKETVMKHTADALRANGFQPIIAHDAEDALKEILELIPPGSVVGIGGSVTTREIGLPEALGTRGYVLADHWRPGISNNERRDIRMRQLASDTFVCSTNAVTMDGKLVNIDGTGNRVAAMIFGPKKTIVIAGFNKIVRNLEEALTRARNVAAPMNARRLKLRTPCAETGACSDCDSPDRICRAVTILEKKPSSSEIVVVLVGEALGF